MGFNSAFKGLIFNNTHYKVCLTPWAFELMLERVCAPEKLLQHPGATFSGIK
jgi:hypothetical protein